MNNIKKWKKGEILKCFWRIKMLFTDLKKKQAIFLDEIKIYAEKLF